MKYLFFTLTLLFILTSCGRKKQVVNERDEDVGGTIFHVTEYADRDSFFREYRQNGQTIFLFSAASDSALSDSTFRETEFFPGNHVKSISEYLQGKKHGSWSLYFPNGKLQYISRNRNGYLDDYHSWFGNGQAEVIANRLPDGRMVRTEFFADGDTSQYFETDSVGNGHCKTWYPELKYRAEGNLYHFIPVGIWKRFDSLGKPMHDTLLGVTR